MSRHIDPGKLAIADQIHAQAANFLDVLVGCARIAQHEVQSDAPGEAHHVAELTVEIRKSMETGGSSVGMLSAALALAVYRLARVGGAK